ncbi:hypothetical protein [Serratia proteamaculans]|uniref:hypothetical protein n=1 Tax=Serratia proteamaculans TaxID=28151 RepID=UPI003D01544C
MKAMTADDVLRSQPFFLAATMDALKVVAEASGRQFSDAVEDYKHRVPVVFEPVERLVLQAAQDMAEILNAGL